MNLIKKNLVPAIVGFILIGAVASALIIGEKDSKSGNQDKTLSKAPACGSYRSDTSVTINGHRFSTELAKSPAEYDKGLGGRPCITDSQAMLFAFTRPGQYPFWMKGMKFPIDIIWIGADRRVAAAEIDERPSTYPDKFVNQKPAQFVLEIKANLSKQLHIVIGTPVTF